MKYALLAPALILCGLFVVWPLGELVRMSFSNGLQNYALMFSDADFGRSIINSLIYSVLSIPLVVIPLMVAVNTVSLSKRMQDVVRFVVYVPSVCCGLVIAAIWKWIFHIKGPINWLLGTDIEFLGNAVTAIPAVVIATTMGTFGLVALVFIGALLNIDPALYDAAKIDGASPLQIRWRIMVPAVMPWVWVFILLAAIAAPQVIEYVMALAPQHGSTMGSDIYKTAWTDGRHGYAAAKAIALFAWMIVLVWGKTKLSKEAAA